MTGIVRMLVGLGLLTLGRKLFWLFVALVGFEFGFFLADRFFLRGTNEILAFIIALLFGVVAALLAVFLQQLAIFVGGFLAGGAVLVRILELIGIGGGPRLENIFLLIVYVIGGVIGAIVLLLLFDWALILLSALAGASIIAGIVAGGGTPIAAGFATLVFIALFIAGVIIQAVLKARE